MLILTYQEREFKKTTTSCIIVCIIMADIISYNSASQQPSYGKKLKLLVVIIVFAGVIGIVAKVTSVITSNNPSHIASQFVQGIKNNQVQPTYNLTSSAFKSQTSTTVWKQTVSTVSKQLQSSPKLNSQQQSGDSEVFLYSVKAANQDYTLRLVTKKDKGKWRVDTFEYIPNQNLGT